MSFGVFNFSTFKIFNILCKFQISTLSPLYNLTTFAYFHRFQLFWYWNIQLFQEILGLTFNVSNFYTFLNI